MRKHSLIGVLLLVSMPAWSVPPGGQAAEEAKLLPPYCQGDANWKSILGPEIVNNNHTCYGILKLNQYYRITSAQKKRVLLLEALGDFNYSVRHLKPDFKLMPEIYFYRGTTYRLLARNGEAMSDFLKAVSLDPNYARAYSELADIYMHKLSKRDKALEIVTEGLRHNPQVKALQRRYTDFGGKLPYPEPVDKTAHTEDVKPESKTEEKLKSAQSPEVKIGQESGANAMTAPSVPASLSEQEKIGTPNNPYCRFCPD